MSSKRVLIVTYYWPPSGGSGVQRWLKFVKYLDRLGWETYVVAPENPSFTTQDPSLLADVPVQTEVLKLPIWEPYNAFHRLSSLFGGKASGTSDFISTTKKKSTFGRLANWVRGNMFIPDPRVFWVRPVTTFLSDFIQSNHIDKIITTGPPHSVHLIGLRLKKKYPSLKWVADFRDPWSEWDLLDTLDLTAPARRRHQTLERRVLEQADRVITIAPFHVHRFEALGKRKVDLITNGFDTDDFAKVTRIRTSVFTIRHTGVVDELRDPRPMMKALKLAFQLAPTMKSQTQVEFIGNVNSAFKEFVANDPELSSVVRFIPNIPHAELLRVYGETDVLLLILAHTAIAPGNLPGKFFEYLASGVPILASGPVGGDADEVLKEVRAGSLFAIENVTAMSEAFYEHFATWSRGDAPAPTDPSAFTREKLTTKLAALLEELG